MKAISGQPKSSRLEYSRRRRIWRNTELELPLDYHFKHKESITVNITYLKWTFIYLFWIRVEIHPQGNPTASQLLDIDEPQPLLKSLSTALLIYYKFPEPHLNESQVHVYGELMDRLSYKVNWIKIMANTHVAYPDLALDKFFGSDLDQDAGSFVQLIERKINCALGDAPADPNELVN